MRDVRTPVSWRRGVQTLYVEFGVAFGTLLQDFISLVAFGYFRSSSASCPSSCLGSVPCDR